MDSRNIWNEAMTLTLLDEYEANEHLWNAFNPDYTNKQRREEAYTNIIRALDPETVTLKDVKTKLKNLRSSYSNELRKVRDTRHMGGKEYAPKVFWFHKMDAFLHDVVVPQPTFEDYQGPMYGMRNDHPASDPIASVPLCSKLVPKKLIKKEKTEERVIKKTRKLKRAIEDTRCIATRSNDEDEFDAFGRNMALQLRTLPLEIALQTQIKMQTMLAEARIAFASGVQKLDYSPSSTHFIDFELSSQSEDMQEDS